MITEAESRDAWLLALQIEVGHEPRNIAGKSKEIGFSPRASIKYCQPLDLA